MLMGHPPQIIPCGRENIPQGCFKGLTSVQMLMIVQDLVAYDAEMQKALADTLEAVQKMAQAGPNAFHRVTIEFMPIKSSVAMGSGVPGSCAGHSRVPSRDRGRPPSTG